METDNIAQDFFSAVIKAAKAQKKADTPPSSVNYTVDLANRRITGTFIITLEENTTETAGEVILKVSNNLIAPETAQ